MSTFDSESSYGVLSYFDACFLDWTSALVRGGILNSDNYLLNGPNLFGCAPSVCTLDTDRLTIGELQDMTPAGGFAYVLTRRVAEAVARTVCSWLVPGWLTALLVVLLTTWLQDIVSSWQGNRGRRRDRTLLGFSSKNVFRLLTVVPLTILLPFLIEIAFGGVLDFQLQFLTVPKESSFWTFWDLFALVQSEVTPSILDLLQVVSLADILFGRSRPSSLPRSTPRQKLCLQTRLSLMYWSSLVFVAAVYLLVLLLFKVLVIGPFMGVIGRWKTEKSGDPRAGAKGQKKSPRGTNGSVSEPNLDSANNRSHSESENLMEQLDNYDYPDPEILFTERGDSRGNAQLTEDSHNPSHESGDGQGRESSFQQMLVVPRFISRAISAILESSDFSSSSSDEQQE